MYAYLIKRRYKPPDWVAQHPETWGGGGHHVTCNGGRLLEKMRAEGLRVSMCTSPVFKRESATQRSHLSPSSSSLAIFLPSSRSDMALLLPHTTRHLSNTFGAISYYLKVQRSQNEPVMVFIVTQAAFSALHDTASRLFTLSGGGGGLETLRKHTSAYGANGDIKRSFKV